MTYDIIFNTIGMIGVIMMLLAYFLLQKGIFSDHNNNYLLLNLIGAIMSIISLCWAWNLSAFIIECIWSAISIYGLIKNNLKSKP